MDGASVGLRYMKSRSWKVLYKYLDLLNTTASLTNCRQHAARMHGSARALLCLLSLWLRLCVAQPQSAQPQSAQPQSAQPQNAQPQNATALLASIPVVDGVLQLNETTLPVAAATYDPLFLLLDLDKRYDSLMLSRRFADAAQAVRQNTRNMTSTLRFASLNVRGLSQTLPNAISVLGLPTLLRLRCPSMGLKSTTISSTNDPWSVSCSIANGAVDVYTGGRTSMEFQRFILNRPMREPTDIKTLQELKALTRERPFVALFLVDGGDSQEYLDCRVLAQIDVDTSEYAVTVNGRIFEGDPQHLQLPGIPGLVLFRGFGRDRVTFTGTWNKADLAQFIQKNRYKLISTYSSEEPSYFYDPSAAGHVLLFSDENEAYHATVLKEAERIALSYYSNANIPAKYLLRFIIIPKEEETLKNALFVLDDQYPTVLVLQKLSDPPIRLQFTKDSLTTIQDGTQFPDALSRKLQDIFPVAGTADGPDDGDPLEPPVSDETKDWRDYSDLFMNRQVPVMTVPLANGVIDVAEVSDDDGSGDGTSPPDVMPPRDLFFSIFRFPPDESVTPLLPPLVKEVTKRDELFTLWPSDNNRVLVFVHSSKCFACRQAEPVIDELVLRLRGDQRMSSQPITTVATINIDGGDLRNWPQTYDLLPGIFLLSPSQTVATYPSRTAITVDALLQFVFPDPQ